MAITADSHGAPPTAVRAGIVVEKEATGGVGAAADRSAGAFDEELGGGTCECREEPVQAAFAGDKLEGPGTFVGDQLIMAIGDAKNLVDRFNPGRREWLIVDYGCENGAKRFAKTQDAQKDGVYGP